MKINKKIKTSLISALTLVASAVSVVACGSKDNTEGDANYKAFLSNITAKDLTVGGFIKDHTSLALYQGQSEGMPNLKYSPEDGKLQEENLKFFDVSNKTKTTNGKETSKNLTDLKDGGIQYNTDNTDIVFNFDSKSVSLENILFYENFNINVSGDTNGTGKTTFKNITLFFQFKTDTSDKTGFSVDFQDGKNLSWLKQNNNFNPSDVTFDDSIKDDDIHLGLEENKDNYTYWDSTGWKEDFTIDGTWSTPANANLVDNFSTIDGDTITMDGKGNVTFNSSNAIFFCQFNGKANDTDKKGYNIMADFYVLVNKDNKSFSTSSNFYAFFDAKAI